MREKVSCQVKHIKIELLVLRLGFLVKGHTKKKKKKGKTLQENSDYKQVHSIKTWFHSYSVSNKIFQMNLGKQ